MMKLQKRKKSEVYLPVALQAGVPYTRSSLVPTTVSTLTSSVGVPTSSIPLSPFQKIHRRAASSPRKPQTEWPLITKSSLPSVAYPSSSPRHDASKCGSNCIRCGKRKLIQLNNPPSKNIPNTSAPLRPMPQAHIRAVSDGVLNKAGPNRLSIITTTPSALIPGKPISCHKCGKLVRPASLPMPSSSKQVQLQLPSSHEHQRQPSQHYGELRTYVSGATSGTPHPSKLPSRSPSPSSPNHFSSNEEYIVSPLTPRRKVNFSFPRKSPSPSDGSSSLYSQLSASEKTPPEIGTGRLINLISTAIREASPPSSASLPAGAHDPSPHASPPPPLAGPHEDTRIRRNHTSTQAVLGLNLLHPDLSANVSADVSEDEDARTVRLSTYRSPVDARMPMAPIELDSRPVGTATVDREGARILARNEVHRDVEAGEEGGGEFAEYGHDWTDAISVPVMRMPSFREGISRFNSLRGGGRQNGRPGINRGPSFRERFGSLRGDARGQHRHGRYGRGGSGYQVLGSNLEIGVH